MSEQMRLSASTREWLDWALSEQRGTVFRRLVAGRISSTPASPFQFSTRGQPSGLDAVREAPAPPMERGRPAGRARYRDQL